MSEATEYLLENHKKTFEIYNAIAHMEEEILSKIDKAIREHFPYWVEGEWNCTDEENLKDDYCITIIRNEWSYQNDKEEILSYLWTYLQLDGDDPIWTFLGLPNEDEDNSVNIVIWLSEEFKQLTNYQTFVVEFDKRNQELLENAGFTKKGGNINPKTGRNVNRKYERKIHFSNTSILSGLKNDDWEEALEELKDVWKVIEKIDWEFLKKPIAKHQKTTEQIN